MTWWTRLKAAFGSASIPTPPIGGSDVIGARSVWQQFTRIGGNLTPADVTSIIRQADGGDPSRLVDLANDARQKDGHLHSNLSTRENALTALPLTVVPFKARDERKPAPRDADVAAFVSDAIDGAVGDGDELRSVDELVPHLNGAVYHGFSHAGIAWERAGRQLMPAGFSLIDQRRFQFRQSDGRLVFADGRVSGWGGSAGIDLVREYPGQYMQHTPRINGDVPVREGLSHLLVWAATFRNWGLVDWLKLAELAWKPWRIGKRLGKAGDTDKGELLTALQHLTSSGIMVHGPEIEVDLRWPGQEGRGSSTSTHKELADWLGAEMSKAILGQTLTTEQGSSGAYSLGKVHDEVRKDIRDQDGKAVAATIRRDLVRPLVLLNFGDVPIPGVEFQTDDSTDLGEFSSAITMLKDAGLSIPEWWVYDVTGVPAPQEGDAVLGDSGEDVDVDMTELDADEESVESTSPDQE